MVKEFYFIVVGKSKGGPGSAETPDNGTGSSANKVDGADVIPTNKIVTSRRDRDGVDMAASEFSISSTGHETSTSRTSSRIYRLDRSR